MHFPAVYCETDVMLHSAWSSFLELGHDCLQITFVIIISSSSSSSSSSIIIIIIIITHFDITVIVDWA